MTDSRIRAATIAVFVAAVLLRLVLATVNREQSDNHVTLIEIIASENRIPDYDREHEAPKEGFQPKLYHATVAQILRLDPSDRTYAPCVVESYPGSPHVVWVGQMVSCLAGILTICVVWRFLGIVGLSTKTRFFAFALIALNPALIGINIQATNDSFMILFGALTLHWGYRFFRDFRVQDFVLMTAAATATVMSKATGLPLVLSTVAVFAITFARGPNDGTPARAVVLRYATLFLVVILTTFTVVAPKVGTYWEHYRRHGTPFVTNRLAEPFPRLFAPTVFTGDPGVRSIAESLFTFRIIGLLRVPTVFNGRIDDFPLHRTSLWSQVYGRLNFIHFDDYFETWRSDSPMMANLGRLAFLVALFPAGMFLAGALRALARASRRPGDVRPHEWLIGIAAAAYAAFLTALALRYRDYSFFKPIHAYAGLLAFSVVFARALDRFDAGVHARQARRVGDVLLAALVLIYALDCTLLALHLFRSCRIA